MRFLPRLFFCVVAVLSLLPLRAFAAEEWIRIDSPHFTVITDGGEKRGRDVAKHFEQMRAVFETVTKRKLAADAPIVIFAFRNTKGLRQNSPLWQGKPIELAGFFQGSRDGNYIALDLSIQNPYHAVTHEYAHVLLNSSFERMPAWFDEGFAEFYSTTTIDSKKVTIGAAPEGDAYILLQNSLMPVEQLVAVQHDSRVYNESGDHRNLFYAQSWLLVHYLMDKHLVGKAGEFMSLVEDRHEPVSDAMKQAFGMDPKELYRALRDYLSGNRVGGWTLPTPPEAEQFTYQAHTLDAADAEASLADLHLHMQDYRAQAKREFAEVLATRPSQGLAHRGLGYLALQSGDLDTATTEFAKAAADDHNDSWVHYYAGTLALRKGHDEDTVVAARTELSTAVRLNPGFADGYAQLAQANALAQDYEAAAAAMRRACQLSPREEHYTLELGRFYLFAKNWSAAEPLLQRAKASTDPAIAASAEQGLTILASVKSLPADRVRIDSSGRFIADGPVPAAGGPPVIVPASASADRGAGVTTLPAAAPVKWAKATLVKVECKDPAAVLTVAMSGGQTLRVTTRDYRKLVIIGDDKFSCSWQNKKVALNYRDGGSTDSEIVSLEEVQ